MEYRTTGRGDELSLPPSPGGDLLSDVSTGIGRDLSLFLSLREPQVYATKPSRRGTTKPLERRQLARQKHAGLWGERRTHGAYGGSWPFLGYADSCAKAEITCPKMSRKDL
jgi:hypothetical protein